MLDKFVDANDQKIDTTTISDAPTVEAASSAFNLINDGSLKSPKDDEKANPTEPVLPAFDKWDVLSSEYTSFIANIKTLFDGLFGSGEPFDYTSLDSITNSGSDGSRHANRFSQEMTELANQAKNGVNGTLPSSNLTQLESISVTNTVYSAFMRQILLVNIVSAGNNIKNNPVDLNGRINWVGDYTSADATVQEAIRLIKIEFPAFNPSDTSGNGWTVETGFPVDTVSVVDWSAGVQAAKALTNSFASSRSFIDTSTIAGDTPSIVKANAKLLAIDHTGNLGSNASHIDVDTISSPAAVGYTTTTFDAIKQSYIDIVSNYVDGDGGDAVDTTLFEVSTTTTELQIAWDAIDFYTKGIGSPVNIIVPDIPLKDYVEQSKLVTWVDKIKESFYSIKDNDKTKTFFASLDTFLASDDKDQDLIDSIQKLSEDFLKTVN